jgi:phosphoglycolate phosphatase-like HAD superfamily hydrolase
LIRNNAKLFDGVEKKLESLHARYNFAVITATDEQVVDAYLRNHRLDTYFPYILGKLDPFLKSQREYTYHKTALLMKFSQMAGVPLSRIVYVGDSNTDYLATNQLGIPFVEARLVSTLPGEKTLVQTQGIARLKLGYFTTYTNNQLDAILEEYSKELAYEKYKIARA